jgi:prolyl-tRNA synthetase
MFIPTVREVPSDAEISSHKLMIRSGMIRKLTSGIYSYLPLGLRVIRKIENIIRDEMNSAGALEVLLPAVQPAELWQESGRWKIYGKELLRFKDRHSREYCIGPTHEEVITDLIRNDIKTYRQLPKIFYQIQMKFRDEIRPRFGVMRCREFFMKDAYSFDVDDDGVDMSYKKMFQAYMNIFHRCGLTFRPVEADTGNIGGSFSHEFMVIADTGEDALIFCNSCDYAANIEKAEISRPAKMDSNDKIVKNIISVHTPHVRTIDEVSAFMQVPKKDIVKTLIFIADGNPIAALIRGDEEVNEAKLRSVLGCDDLELASDEIILAVTGTPRGFSGAMGIKARIIADYSLINMNNFVMGANQKDYHIKNVNVDRDFIVDIFADIRLIKETDVCPRCCKEIRFSRGVEVGHTFKLGTKYSKAMGASILDQNGQQIDMIMGCYGIGIGRTMAACIEQNYDVKGISWPMPLAPFQVIVLPVNVRDETIMESSEMLHKNMRENGIEVLLDDRDERAGVKFNDADLIGIPIRITVGPKQIAHGKVEIRMRKTGMDHIVQLDEAVNFTVQMVKDELAKHATNH